MRKFLGTLVMLALILAGLGYFRGWFGVSTDDQPGETNIEVTIDKDKVKEDAASAAEKVRELATDDDVQDNDESEQPTSADDEVATE